MHTLPHATPSGSLQPIAFAPRSVRGGWQPIVVWNGHHGDPHSNHGLRERTARGRVDVRFAAARRAARGRRSKGVPTTRVAGTESTGRAIRAAATGAPAGGRMHRIRLPSQPRRGSRACVRAARRPAGDRALERDGDEVATHRGHRANTSRHPPVALRRPRSVRRCSGAGFGGSRVAGAGGTSGAQ